MSRRPSPKRAASTTEMNAVWPVLYQRTAGRCEVCYGTMLDGAMQAHHRVLRSRGGGDGLSNLIGCCASCHEGIHKTPTASTERGWMVPAGTDPATVPALLMTTAGQARWLLDDEGAYTWTERP